MTHNPLTMHHGKAVSRCSTFMEHRNDTHVPRYRLDNCDLGPGPRIAVADHNRHRTRRVLREAAMRCLIFVAASALLAAPAQAATFARNGDRLTITGSIGEADAIVFEIQLNDRVRTIELNSSGGYLDEAMAIGRSIRGRRLDTVIPAGAICESACALIWSAGWRRTANGHLAMHCAVAAAVPYQCDQAARVRMVAYLAELSISRPLAARQCSMSNPRSCLSPMRASSRSRRHHHAVFRHHHHRRRAGSTAQTAA